jgi:hypothetical protein
MYQHLRSWWRNGGRPAGDDAGHTSTMIFPWTIAAASGMFAQL